MTNKLRLIRRYFENPLDYIQRDTMRRQENGIFFKLIPLHALLDAKYLGHGHFSNVLALNDKWVLKIACRNADPAYDEWAKYCMANYRTNPWLPRIRARFEIKGVKLYILERLTKASWTEADRLYGYIANPSSCPCPNLERALTEFGAANFTDVREDNVMRRGTQLVMTDICHRFKGLGKMRGEQHQLAALLDPQPFVTRRRSRELNRSQLSM